MELIYATMLLHKLGKDVNEANVTKVLEAAGAKVDAGQVKALLAALDGVDIDQAIKEAAVPVAAAAPAGNAPAEAKKEAPKEEKKEDPGQAAAGLGALFG